MLKFPFDLLILFSHCATFVKDWIIDEPYHQCYLVKYNIHSVDVCILQEPRLRDKWRGPLEYLEAFKHRYGQSKNIFWQHNQEPTMA